MKEGPAYRIGDLYPPSDDARMKGLAFMVAAHALLSCARLHGRLKDDGLKTTWEIRNLNMLLSAGLAYEAAKAFAYADEAGVFAGLENDAFSRPRLKRLRVDCDHSNPESFRSDTMKALRHKVSFHWDLEWLREAVATKAEYHAPLWISDFDDESIAGVSIPVWSLLPYWAIETKLTALPGGMLGERLAKFQSNLFHLAHRLLLHWAGKARPVEAE